MKPHRLHTPLLLLMGLLALALVRCSSASVPADAVPTDQTAQIYPDYTGVIDIPRNIAPLNFDIRIDADEYVTHLHAPGTEGIVISGKEVRIPLDEWRSLLASTDTVCVDVYTRQGDAFSLHAPIRWAVAEEIDPYITYRLIEPSYVNYETITINERSLTDYDEREIYNNCPWADGAEGQCANCHVPQDYNRQGVSQMHLRSHGAGTLIIRGDRVEKVPLRDSTTISAGVYPAWHPTLPLAVYSVNTTRQAFHNANPDKIEVYDKASDLILYDIDAHTITPLGHTPLLLETFPAWDPSGDTLYYACAALPDSAALSDSYVTDHYREIRYDLMRMPFDKATRRFGAPDTVFAASAIGLSATLPRITPDGRRLVFTAAPYGTFHIWHSDADLWMLDLSDGTAAPMVALNSPHTESYHSISSNGRWILFSSRRDDGSYTRLYIARLDTDGRVSKPFLLPQEDPSSNISLFKSYNVPEFLVQPVAVSRATLLDAISSE